MRKPIAVLCLSLALLMAGAATTGAAADGVATTSLPAPELKAKSALLMEYSTGTILYKSNEHEKLPVASVTKIMTELLVLEAVDAGKLKLDQKITVSEHAAAMGGSDIWLEPGEIMTVNDLFRAMAINSANDAAVALGEAVAGSEPAFVQRMNEKAAKLGMNDTHFVNCTGLDADGHVMSAYDVAILSRALMGHKKIFDYCTVWMDSLRDGKTALYNTNKLVRYYIGCNGLKTGSTSKAGWCISATALRDGMQLIAVILGSSTKDERYDSARNLLDYGFAGWQVLKPEPLGKKLTVRVLRGMSAQVEAVAADPPAVLSARGDDKAVEQRVSLAQNVMAPVEKGQVLGQVTYWVDGNRVGTAPLTAAQSVAKMTYFKAFARLLASLVAG